MNSGDEIISLQFGNFANYIGAHYFNIQEAGFSYNPDFIPDILPDRLFRSSKDSSGNILDYTPRTVLVDDEIDNAFMEPPEESKMGDTLKNVTDNSQKVECLPNLSAEQTQKIQEILLKSQKPIENIKSWNDFLNISYHPKSFTCISKEFGLSCPESNYYLGSCCTKQLSFWEKFEDNIRFFAEECDTLQGFQIISEGNTAYSGIASTALNYLKDDYLKKVRILTPAYLIPENASYYEKQVYLCNSVSFLAEANDNTDLIVPISINKNPWKIKELTTNRILKNVKYQGFDKYENSAIIASALEYITLPYRKRDEKNISMRDYCQINTLGRSISNAGILMPFPAVKTDSIPNVLKDWNGSFFDCISPFGSFDLNQSADIMYIFSKGLTKKSFDPTRNMTLEQLIEELLQNLNTFIQTTYSAKIIKNFSSSTNFRVPLNFPNIFDNNYNLIDQHLGSISEFYGISCLINSKEIKNNLELLSSTALMNFRKLRLTSEEALECDFHSLVERLNCLASNYCDNYEL